MCMLHNHQHEHLHDEHKPHGAGRRHDAPAPWYRTPLGVALLPLMGVIAYFLWTEHRAHVIAVLPYALLLLCPLMHVFMHRGHRTHEAEHVHDDSPRRPRGGGS